MALEQGDRFIIIKHLWKYVFILKTELPLDIIYAEWNHSHSDCTSVQTHTWSVYSVGLLWGIRNTVFMCFYVSYTTQTSNIRTQIPRNLQIWVYSPRRANPCTGGKRCGQVCAHKFFILSISVRAQPTHLNNHFHQTSLKPVILSCIWHVAFNVCISFQ